MKCCLGVDSPTDEAQDAETTETAMKKDTTPHGKMVANMDLPAIPDCFDKSPEWAKQLVRLMVANIAAQSTDLDWLATQVKTIVGDEMAVLNEVVNQVISIKEDECSLNAERGEASEAEKVRANNFYKTEIHMAEARLESALEKLEALRAANNLPVS